MTSTSSSASPSSTDTSQGFGFGGLSASTYYASIGVAVLLIAALIVGSRCLYIQKARRVRNRERQAMARRGEEGGLPTYGETTNPTTLSYITNPLSSLRTNGTANAPPSSGVGQSQLPRFLPAVFYPGSRDAIPPPQYADPPKYENEAAIPQRELSSSSVPVPEELHEVPLGQEESRRSDVYPPIGRRS